MLDTIKKLDEEFSETMLSEFAHEEGSIGYGIVMGFIQNSENDYTVEDIKLIRKVVQRDCEIYGW